MEPDRTRLLNGNKALEDQIFYQNYTTQRFLMSLMSSAAPAEALVCDQCGATFSSEEALEAHRLTHTGNTTQTASKAVTPKLALSNRLVMLAGFNCSCHDAP